MTENESIESLREEYMDMECYFAEHDCYPKGYDAEFQQAMATAMKALKEIQQYRAIGTVEECREARERQRGRRPVYPYLKSFPTCPNCGEVNLQQENEYGNVVANYDFCPDCGQAILWESDTP